MKKIIQKIKNSKNILIVAHRRPDGDSIGSQLSLYLILKQLNKNVKILNTDPVPEMFRFLKSYINIKRTLNKSFEPDIIIFLDSASKTRVGEKILNKMKSFNNNTIINIDHHISNKKYGHLNYVRSDASSTAEIIFKLAKQMKIKIDKSIAEALLTGIITDTGFFKFDTVNYKTLNIASELVKYGADIHFIAMEVYMNRPIPKVRLISFVFSRMKIINDKVYSYITNNDFKKTGALSEYTDGIVNELLYLKGINAAVLIIEDGKNVRISFRSKGKYNMNELASHFGGGGHINASGAYVDNISLKGVIRRIEKELVSL